MSRITLGLVNCPGLPRVTVNCQDYPGSQLIVRIIQCLVNCPGLSLVWLIVQDYPGKVKSPGLPRFYLWWYVCYVQGPCQQGTVIMMDKVRLIFIFYNFFIFLFSLLVGRLSVTLSIHKFSGFFLALIDNAHYLTFFLFLKKDHFRLKKKDCLKYNFVCRKYIKKMEKKLIFFIHFFPRDPLSPGGNQSSSQNYTKS